MVDARRCDFALHSYHASLAFCGQTQIVAPHDGDHVTGLQKQVVRWVFLSHGFAEIKREQFGAQFVLVKPFNDGVVPVDLVDHATNALAEGGTHTAFFVQGAGCGNGFDGQTQVFGKLLRFFDGLNLRGGETLSLQVGRTVLHQLVFTAVVIRSDECFTVRDQVLHTHAAEPCVTQGLSHRTLQRDSVAKCRTDGEQCDDIAVCQWLSQALGIEHHVLYLAWCCSLS